MIDATIPSTLMPVYGKRLPIAFTRGQGIWLWNDKSVHTPYLDALSGKSVSNLGHSHPQLIHALQIQVSKLLHTSNLYRITQQEELANALCQKFKMQQVFFSNSGTETVETAIKIMHLFGAHKTIKKPIIISIKGSYHGRTLGALKLSSSPQLIKEKQHILFDKTEENIQVPINNVTVLRDVVDQYRLRIVGIIVEPIQGDNGIQSCSKEFLQTIRALCDRYDFLMVADEIQTGLCRTGPWLACHRFSVQPDVLLLSKALGNGIPIGAYLVNAKSKDCLKNSHGSTFSGNPLACTAALTVMERLEVENIEDNVQKNGEILKTKLQETLKAYPIVQAVRGEGLMLGIQLKHHCPDITSYGLAQRLLFDVVGKNTIRLLPPLILTTVEIDELVVRLVRTIKQYLKCNHFN